MYDPFLVRICESACDVFENVRDGVECHRSLAVHAGAQRFAVNERHGVVQMLARETGVEQRHDVRMLQPRCEGDLALEAFGGKGGREFRRKHLDHDPSTERCFRRDKDTRHPAARQLALDRVLTAERCLNLRLQSLVRHDTTLA